MGPRSTVKRDQQEIIEFWHKQYDGKTVCLCQNTGSKELFCFPGASPPNHIDWIVVICSVCGDVGPYLP